jgi:hypothetical protein
MAMGAGPRTAGGIEEEPLSADAPRTARRLARAVLTSAVLAIAVGLMESGASELSTAGHLLELGDWRAATTGHLRDSSSAPGLAAGASPSDVCSLQALLS